MRKTKEVLGLRFELGLGQRAIARACSSARAPFMSICREPPQPASSGLSKRSGRATPRRGAVWRAAISPAPSRARASGFFFPTPAVATTSTLNPAVGLARVSASTSSGIRLQLLLRAVRTVAPEARRGAAPSVQAWREGFRRLGRSDDQRCTIQSLARSGQLRYS